MTRSATVAHAETVGSLLKPERLLAARRRQEIGELSVAELRAIEDEAVLDAIALQESAGLDVVTDGEMRRPGWADTGRHLEGFESRSGMRSYPTSVRLNGGMSNGFPTVVRKITPKPGEQFGGEFAFLKDHAARPTKYTMVAPSFHRRFWSDELSTAAYSTCEDFLVDVRDWLREVARRLAASGCEYLQLDAPNYGSLCDPDNRAFHAAHGHNLDKQIEFDAKLDSSTFEGLDLTRALHVCRGNMPGGVWHSSGGYEPIAGILFPNLDVDVLLLEYDTDRAGDFGPIEHLASGTVAVLGLVTTKEAALEDAKDLEDRIKEAATHKDLDELALSTQCGFASAANAPMTEAQQGAKLRRVCDVAHRIWA